MMTIHKVYDQSRDAYATVAELEARGIGSDNVSIITHELLDESSGTTTGATIGGAVGGTAGLLTGIGLMAIPGVGPVVAAGWLAATQEGTAAGAVTGGNNGALTDDGTDADVAEVYAEAVRRGGTLVSVRVNDNRQEEVEAILNGRRPIDPALRRRDYTDAGWNGFDHDSPLVGGPRSDGTDVPRSAPTYVR